MSRARRQAAPSPRELWQAAPAAGRGADARLLDSPCGEAGDDSGSDAKGRPRSTRTPDTVMAAGGGPAAACRVDASARRVPGARRPGGTARTVETATPGSPLAGVPARETERSAGDCRATLTRGSGVPLPVRGARRGAWRAIRMAHGHQSGKGQEAYFPADGTGVRRTTGIARLSRCESPICAQDLQSATLGNRTHTKSNLFGFVMT
jgi:hypothetical protein